MWVPVAQGGRKGVGRESGEEFQIWVPKSLGGAARADEQDSAFFVLSTESKTMDGDDAWKEMNE